MATGEFAVKTTNSRLPFAICLIPAAFQAMAAEAPPSAVEHSQQGVSLEEVVVTAERRARKLQDVPITVSAITGDAAALAGVTGTSSLQATVPSLSIDNHGNSATPFLRGIGSSSGDSNSEASVAIYLDGIYQPAPFGNFFEFNNIERVEVLKGPQGTLFGRNSTGGVIQVITRDPSHTPTAEISAGYANYDKTSSSFYGSSGLGEDFAANVSLLYSRQSEGWGDNLTTGGKSTGAKDLGTRIKFLYTPGESTTLRLAADYSRSDAGAISGQPPPGAATFIGQGYPGRFDVWSDHTDTSEIESRGASVKLDHDFGPLQLASISAYRKTDGEWTLDQDLSSVPLVEAALPQKAKMYTQELHLLSPADSKLRWLVGAFYYNYEAHQSVELRGLAFTGVPGGGIDNIGATKTVSTSLFAQGTYPLSEATNLTLGGRYSWERVTGTTYATFGGSSIIIDPFDGQPAHPKLSYEKPSWRIALDHRLASDILAYVSYNRGIKSGNIGLGGAPAQNVPYDPEQLDAYETGLKSEWLNRRLRLNSAVFYYDFKNIQFQRTVNGAAITFNGPSAELYGGEIELEFRATSRLTLNANLGLLHTQFGDFPNAPNTRRLANGMNDAGDPNYNAEGNELPNAPEVTGNVGFNYDIPTNSGVFNLTSNVYYNAGQKTEVDSRLEVDSYTLVNATIGWTSPDDHWDARLWGKNLTDEYYYRQLTGLADATDIGSPAAPRTFGVMVRYKF